MKRLYSIERDCISWGMTVARTENHQQIVVSGKGLNKAPIWFIEELENDPRVIIQGNYKSIQQRQKEEHNKMIKAKIKKLEKEIETLEKEIETLKKELI